MNKKIVRRVHTTLPNFGENLPSLIQQIYCARGITSNDELLLTTNKLVPVNDLKDIEKASAVVYQALIKQQKIMIIGDFDADGATSTALMMEGLSMMGAKNLSFLVPNRFEYGYGLSPEIVEIAHQQAAELIITVDNGISCHQGVTKANELGMQVVITDHHLAGDKLPNAQAIVNPNQPGCLFASKAIAGVGVAFYLMLALRKYCREQQWFAQQNIPEPNLAQLLDLVALGTVADVVALDTNNRILVDQGLKRIRAGHTRPGIQALIEIANRNQQQLVASDFGFALGPRINAAGRLDDMAFGINCLLATDINQARVMAQELDHLNKARREIEQGMQLEAEKVMAQLNMHTQNLPHAIALFQNDWHQGVIGIVAGRIKERYYRPTIVFAAASDDNQDEIKGSARSIPGLHIRDLLEYMNTQHPDLIIKFGGHAMAAGLSIKTENFTLFQQLFNQYAQQWIDDDVLKAIVLSDGELPLDYFSLTFAQQLRNAGPWGQAFPEPVFDDTFALIQQRLVGDKHLKMVVEKEGNVFDAIAFNVDLTQWPNAKAKQIHFAYKLDINEFRGKQNLQLMVEHIASYR